MSQKVAKILYRILILLILLSDFGFLSAQGVEEGDRNVIISNILITGNKKTKDHIILRELNVNIGDRYLLSVLNEILEADRNKIYNTSLFNAVDLTTYDLDSTRIVIQIDVEERWYLYPIPKVEFVDRNFNDWVVNQNADLSRLSYGIKFTQYNFRGRNERLHLLLQAGYTRQVGLRYDVPYLDKNQKTGFSMKVNYGENTNIAIATIDNLREFLDSQDIIYQFFETGLSITRRRSFFNRHSVGLEYASRMIADTVVAVNPNYFGESKNSQKFFSLGYHYQSDHRDIVAYPLNGYDFRVSVIKRGIGVYDDLDLWVVQSSFAKYWEFKKRFFLSNYSSVFLSSPDTQPYSVVSGLGYSKNVIRGYELNVIEGQSYVLNKTTFKKEILNIKTKLKPIPIEQFQTFPLAIYVKTFFDFGYVNSLRNPLLNTELTNKWIFGYGLGVDFFTTYDLVVRTEYSFNSQGQSGFFLHFRKEF